MAGLQRSKQRPRLCFIISVFSTFLLILISREFGDRQLEERHTRDLEDLVDSTEIPAEHIDPAAIDLTPLVNTLINTSQSGSRQLFSLLSVTSYSSLALHKLTLLVYNISSIQSLESNVFRRRFCYCVTNETNDLTDFTAILLDVMGNSTSYLQEIFKSASILSVSQRNNSDCIYICVMAGTMGREVPELWEVDSIIPLFNQTIVEGPHRGNVSSIRLPVEWNQLPTNLSHVSPSGMSSMLTSRVHSTAHVSVPTVEDTAAPSTRTTGTSPLPATDEPQRQTTADAPETTTQEVTTQTATTQEVTTQTATKQEVTTQTATKQEVTTQRATAQEVTTQRATAQEVTTQRATAQEVTTQRATTQEVTTQRATTQEVTTQTATTQEVTRQEATAQEVTTQKATTQEVVTQEATTQEVTTQRQTKQEVTTQKATTQEVVTQEATTQEVTTQRQTKQEVTTQRATTQEVTTQEVTTQEVTTQRATTQEVTTQRATTQEVTTQRATTQEVTTHAAVKSQTMDTETSTFMTMLQPDASREHTTTQQVTMATAATTTSSPGISPSPLTSASQHHSRTTRHPSSTASPTRLTPVHHTEGPVLAKRTTEALSKRTTIPSKTVETEKPGCPWRRTDASASGSTTTVSAHKLQPCVFELCKFFSQCLCGPFVQRTRMKRYCDDSHLWYEKHTSEVCRRVRRVSFSRNLKQRCLMKMCNKL